MKDLRIVYLCSTLRNRAQKKRNCWLYRKTRDPTEINIADAAALKTYLLIDFYKDLCNFVEIVSHLRKKKVAQSPTFALLYFSDWNINLENSLSPLYRQFCLVKNTQLLLTNGKRKCDDS